MLPANKTLRVLAALGLVLLLGLATQDTSAQDKKSEPDPNEGKKGKTIGMLTARSENAIELKADGEEKARRYVPRWIGDVPDKGGGFDKTVLKTFSVLKVGSRVEVEWVFEERFRALRVKVLLPPKAEDAKR